MSLCGVMNSKHSWDFVCICVCVVCKWYLIRMSVRSGIWDVGVVMHVLHRLDDRCMV